MSVFPPAAPLWVGAPLTFPRIFLFLSFGVMSSTCFFFFCPGTFGKAPWRPPNDLHMGFGPPNGINSEENPYAAPDAESDPDESGPAGDCVYERPFDSGRTEPTPQRRTST